MIIMLVIMNAVSVSIKENPCCVNAICFNYNSIVDLLVATFTESKIVLLQLVIARPCYCDCG